MLQKHELRIGNLVVLAHESNAPIAEIVEIRNNGSCAKVLGERRREYFMPYEFLMPIVLSNEWLERIGGQYEKEDRQWQYQIQVGALNWYFRWNTEWYSELGGIYLGGQFQYLHSVQNLIHALTGKELTIKEPINDH